MKTRIFATPSEPHFNLEAFAMTPDLLAESLHILAEENDQAIDGEYENGKIGRFKDGAPVEFILRICQQLKLTPATRFTAIELFDRFMAKHICELYDIVRSSSSKDRQTDWETVEKRMKEQLPLRATSCIQVASKLSSHYKALNPSKSKRLLANLGYHYTTASVVKSEIRLLKTLGFRLVVTTPLTFLETLLEVLGANCPAINVKLMYDIGMKLLDVYYLRRGKILVKICRSATTVVRNHDISILGADHLYLATAIIAAGSHILNSSASSMVLNQLFQITQIPEVDITEFAKIIVEEAIGDGMHTQ